MGEVANVAGCRLVDGGPAVAAAGASEAVETLVGAGDAGFELDVVDASGRALVGVAPCEVTEVAAGTALAGNAAFGVDGAVEEVEAVFGAEAAGLALDMVPAAACEGTLAGAALAAVTAAGALGAVLAAAGAAEATEAAGGAGDAGFVLDNVAACDEALVGAALEEGLAAVDLGATAADPAAAGAGDVLAAGAVTGAVVFADVEAGAA